jgi:phosphate-selective porin
VICLSGQLVAREVAHSSLRAIGSRECAPDDRLHQGVNHKQRRSALVRITDLSRTSRHVRKVPRSRHQEGAGLRPRSQTANAISSKPANENQIIAYRM